MKKRALVTALLTLSMVLTSYSYAYAEGEGNLLLTEGTRGEDVVLNGFRGKIVDPGNSLVLLDKSIAKSFDTKERNNYSESSIGEWLNKEFINTLSNPGWVKEGSVSLLSESEWNSYKDYLNDMTYGWLSEAMQPALEPAGYDSILVNNNWNYVKAIMGGQVVGMGYASNYYASPIVLELNSSGYKLKNCFGKPRILIDESSVTSDVGDFSSLSVGDKVRFSNKWWTLVDVESRKILANFDNLSNIYVATEDEYDDIDDSSDNNLMQFSSNITAYDTEDEYSIAHFVNSDYRDTIGTNWITSIDIPSTEQYESWKDIINDTGWMVRGKDESNKDEVYIVGESGLVKVYPGETHPIRVVVKLTGNLYIDDNRNITEDSGVDSEG